MNQKDIATVILSRLYDSYYRDEGAVNLQAICDQMGVDKTSFLNTVEYMSHNDLIKSHGFGGNYEICSKGILQAEEQNLVTGEIKDENQRVRTIILSKLAKVYEEDGTYATVDFGSLSEELGVDIHVLDNNLQVSEDLGYIESVGTGSYKITYLGLDAVEEWKVKVGFVGEYEEISKLEPQPRGRAFQKLLAKVLEKEGWLLEEGARTSHEEMDVIIHKERKYFLIECKWLKVPVEAPVVRELMGKLDNRIGVKGIIVSMSRFASGAVEQAEKNANKQVILFFGKEDIEGLIYQRISFDELLNEKYQQLITRRKIVYK